MLDRVRMLGARIRGLFSMRRVDEDFQQELDIHLSLLTEENIRRGMRPDEARRAARLRLGGLPQLREAHHELSGLPLIETLLRDIRYGLRMLRKSPGFTAIVVLTLALGIGANTAIFSVVNTVLLAPLPYHQVDKLVMVWATNAPKGFKISPVSGGDYAEWKAENNVFDDMAPSSDAVYTLTGAGEPQFLIGYQFSAEYFRLLGVAPEIGRTFLDEEDRHGAPNVVVLNDALWRRTFHADPGILGRAITLEGKPFTVVGVMPPNFQYPQLVELWTPLGLSSTFLSNYDETALRILARLKPGVTLEQAQAQMNSIEQRIAAQHPSTDAGNGVTLMPLREQLAGDVRKPLLILLGAVGFVLLIACANVANLMLARVAGRRKEIAVRTALGATRVRLIRQFLTESILLSLAGGVMGLGLAEWATGFLVSIFPNNIANLQIPKVTAIPIDGRVFAFTLLIAAFTGVLFGLAPILHFIREDVSQGMKESGRATASFRERRFRSALVVSEVALALVLLVGAGLLIESFRNLMRGDLGFDAEHILSAQVFLSYGKYPGSDPQKRLTFVNQVLARMRALPGVESAAVIDFLPLSGFWNTATFTVQGQPQPAPGQEPSSDSRLVTPDYFRTMGIRLVRGRVFTDEDRKGFPQVAIVNERLAHQVWGDRDPTGEKLNLGDSKKPDIWEVVGVVGDVNSFGLEEKTHGDLYQPFAQIPYPLAAFVVRTSLPPTSLTASVEQAIWAVDKDQPIYKIIGMQQLANESLALRRVSTLLLGSFSFLALILAAIGIYGVMAYSVAQRTHEIGVRMALGAQPESVVRMVVSQGMRIAFAGLATGLAGAFALTRVVGSLLYGVKATDPLAFLIVSALLASAALAACIIPARRAMRVDPMEALRYE